MAATDSNVLKLAPDATPPAYRSAPHNIEAEQSLLGAILVNNAAQARVAQPVGGRERLGPLALLFVHTQQIHLLGGILEMRGMYAQQAHGPAALPVLMKQFGNGGKDFCVYLGGAGHGMGGAYGTRRMHDFSCGICSGKSRPIGINSTGC